MKRSCMLQWRLMQLNRINIFKKIYVHERRGLGYTPGSWAPRAKRNSPKCHWPIQPLCVESAERHLFLLGWGSPCPGNVSPVQPTLHRGPLFVVAEGIVGWFRTNWVDCWLSTLPPQQPSMASSFLSSPAERKDSKSHKVFLSQVLQILGEYFITAPDARDLHVQFLLPPPVSWLFTHLLRGLWAHQCHRASWLKALLRSQTGFPGGLAGKESTGRAGDHSSIPGLGRSPGEGVGYPFQYSWASLVAQTIKNPPECRRPWFWSLGWEDPLEKGTATHSSIPAWRIPWTEEPGRLKSMGLERVGHNWLTFTFTKESDRHRFECQLTHIIVKISSFPKSSISPFLKWGLVRIAISGFFQTLNNKMYLYSGWQIIIVIIIVY